MCIKRDEILKSTQQECRHTIGPEKKIQHSGNKTTLHITKVLYGNVWRDKHPSLLEYGISKQVPKFHKIAQEEKKSIYG